MYYTSNERTYFSLSPGIFNSTNKHESTKRYEKMLVLFTFISQSSISQQIMLLIV